ncbi:MAG: hypothetical protein LKM44_01770 [Wolbachia endosymbiont of Meromenopon meropis]|nr:hypothetical protein [Wolbachia endosymbiont of Meromenopon meropis]
MLNRLKKSNTFAQKVHDAYDHDVRKVICIATGLTMLLCRISLQFCCEFINTNRSNIFLIRNVAKWIKFPTSILYIACSTFTLCNLIKNYKDPKNKKELTEIAAKLAGLTSSIIEALIMLKIFHFLTANNANVLNNVHLISTVLFLFIAEPIDYLYKCKKYHNAHKKCHEICKKYQDQKKKTDKCIEHKAEITKCRKSFIIGTITFSLGLLNFALKRIHVSTTPINLGNDVIYNFNLSVIVSIVYGAVFLAIHFNKLFSQTINYCDSSTESNGIKHHIVNDNGNNMSSCII